MGTSQGIGGHAWDTNCTGDCSKAGQSGNMELRVAQYGLRLFSLVVLMNSRGL